MLTITNEIFKEWTDALHFAEFGSPQSIKLFASKYPELFAHMTRMLRQRTKLKCIIGAYKSITNYIHWGALTWNVEKENLEEKVKRHQALRFFDKYFKLYTFVEEYGEENGRYHIHFFGLLKNENITYDMLRDSWHSFLQIECLKGYEHNRKIKYLTKYCVKQVPRIRMDKRSVKLLKDYKAYKHMKNQGFTYFAKEYSRRNIDLMDLPF